MKITMNEELWATANWDALRDVYHDLLMMEHFIGIDLETTGFSPQVHSFIIELSAIRVDDPSEDNWTKFDTLVKPPVSIPKKITNITGITNDMVKDARGFTHIAKELYTFMGDSVIVAHNAMFEQRFLDHYLNYNQLFYTNPYFDTVTAFKLLFPKAKDHKLDTFLEYFGLVNDNWHSADADAYFTLVGFFYLRKKYLEHYGLEDTISYKIDDRPFEPEIWNIKSVNYWEKSPHLKSGKSRLYVKCTSEDNKKFANIFYDYKLEEWDYNNQNTNTPLDFSEMTKLILEKYKVKSLKELNPNFKKDEEVF